MPWVLPADPQPFVDIFHRCGRPVSLAKGQMLYHGGLEGGVALLLEGLSTFSFVDANGAHRIFALVVPGRVVGDLDAVNASRVAVLAEAIRPSKFLVVPIATWRQMTRSSVEMMELYADMAILKEEALLEGAFANFTLDLETRLRVLVYSIYRNYAVPVPQDPAQWVDCPLQLTVTEIAQIVSANRSWVSTKLSEWTEVGVLAKSGRAMRFRGDFFQPVYDWMHGREPAQPERIAMSEAGR
ncbi:MAG: Crp/Fnr family transcriptional regulator [Duodenibacillus sp.]|nr:Crp/Fnr family transcriptional regulator [Duodenibacillus sp.]